LGRAGFSGGAARFRSGDGRVGRSLVHGVAPLLVRCGSLY
jgi:hypothetical protein